MTARPSTAKRALPWVLSAVIHGNLALLLFVLPESSGAPRMRSIELTRRSLPPEPPKPPPPLDPPPVPKPPVKVAMQRQLPRPKVVRPEPPPEQPRPETPPKPPEATRPPTFGIQLSGTAKAAPGTGVQVPEGDTLQAKPTRKQEPRKPGKVGKVERPGFKTDFKTGEQAPLAVVTTMPKVAQRVTADYPERMKELGIEGRVVLELSIDATGRVTRARVVTGLHPQLDAAARAAALKMRFAPATVNGTAVTVKIPYTFTFVLD